MNSTHISSSVEVFLNRFVVKKLNEADQSVYSYIYSLNPPPELGKEYSAIGKMLRNLWIPAVKLGETIVTSEFIPTERLQGETWVLQLQGKRNLNPTNEPEREALEKLQRRLLEQKLRQLSYQLKSNSRFERASEGGLIWWNADKVVLQGEGWEVHIRYSSGCFCTSFRSTLFRSRLAPSILHALESTRVA